MVITICGSMRNLYYMLDIYRKFSLNGHLIFLPVIFPDPQSEVCVFKEKLRKLHFDKIDHSDAIIVVNPNGCIGEDTKAEIEYAMEKDKMVFYTHPRKGEK